MPYGNRTPYFKDCPVCNKNFKVAFWELKCKKTCSFECSKIFKSRIPVSKETRKKISKVKKGFFLKEDSSQWKGDNASYASIHEWIRKTFLKSNKCEKCNKETSRIESHNISKKYTRKREDWTFVCKKCHLELEKEYKII